MSNQQQVKLKPCPFCGCRDVSVNKYIEHEGELWVVECDNCCVQGPDAWNRVDCINAWNKRSNRPWGLRDRRER